MSNDVHKVRRILKGISSNIQYLGKDYKMHLELPGQVVFIGILVFCMIVRCSDIT